MSLISIGKKVGDLDIRIGIPPSKPQFSVSETNERINYNNRTSNYNSVYNQFRTGLAQADGLARPTQYMVTIDGPKGILNTSTFGDVDMSYSEQAQTQVDLARFRTLTSELRRNLALRLDLFCSNVSIPTKTITDDVNEQYYGPSRAIADGVTFDEVTFDFYTGQDFDERVYFEAWQNMIVNPRNYNIGYYDDYAKNCTITITPLKKTFMAALANFSPSGSPERDRETLRRILGTSESAYQVQLYEVYPKIIQSTPFSHDAKDSFIKTSVVFKYRYWNSTTINAISGKVVPAQETLRNEYRKDTANVKGGLLDMLPFGLGNVLGSVGRQVYEKVRRDLPIGRVTGGRVFPKGLPDPKIIRDILY